MRRAGEATRQPTRAALVLGILGALAGCASGQHTCQVGADCISGICNSDGRCAEPRDAARVDGGLGAGDGGEGVDASASDVDAWREDGGARVCSSNGDAVIERSEVPLRAGLHATFRVASDATFATAGTMVVGRRTWDLGGALSGDADQRVDLLDPAGAWWSGTFPTATYAATLSTASTNQGVFQVTDTELLLLGVVSPEDGFTRTQLEYDPPVRVLVFPLHEGDTWTTSSSVSGQLNGVVGVYTEEYVSTVDASGDLVTPLGTMAVLRVRTDLTRTSGLATLATQRTYGFVAECFGTAATITSQLFETSADFSDCSEIRRIAP
ncbi:MAG: hypothetical protein U0234_33150 [Sandaracinus sp.]